ncbi:phenylalanine--tRNA ligase subunit alpha [Gelria sp. Kuro-4]|uniref:phenylalanine--tRNA ligase subunit alpha n=1 Tax=Gelria sp. Kuro-4 TaxID=2796927 RepID=UPI001BED90D9|nr:phenylalanine--tRNA ligase subunit alpha [Gelria sp. Kuro-4]BCV25275.1 phenylalanine--tRNA ligase alpha subunit [Gelria sp. Kuro-4]
MEERLRALAQTAGAAAAQAQNLEELDEVRVRFLGRKGELTQILRSMKDVPPAERPRLGQLANEIRDELERKLAERTEVPKRRLQAQQLEKERLDITLPGVRPALGHKHPLTWVLEEIEDIFLRMGFDVVEEPEVEYDYYNFEALNIPKDHPARDMQDTFYITDEILLRTHTSPFQARTLERMAPEVPVRVICPGRCYRRDPADATHSPMFYQTEVLAVDKNISFAQLKGTLTTFAREMFGKNREVRFRPSFFPFTEPSAEVDISCLVCGGKGCSLCKGTGWLEILGSGMVHPRELEIAGYDPSRVSGFAVGMGPDRIAMLKYGIDDIRLFYEDDLRFLHQF